MKPLDRDIHILEHIVSYCQQIEETVARFGNDGSIFSSDPIYRNAAAICIQQKRLEHFSKGSVSKLAHAKSRKPTLLKYIIRVPLGYALLVHGFGLSRQNQQAAAGVQELLRTAALPLNRVQFPLHRVHFLAPPLEFSCAFPHHNTLP